MAASTRPPAAVRRRPAHASVLAAGLVLAASYAAFASGATRYPQETRLQVLLVLVALGAGVSWAAGAGIRWRVSRPAALGLAGFAGVAAWSSLSLLWSITPDQTWLEANRAIAYALVVALGLAYGASDPRAVERIGVGLLGSAALVGVYALGTKTLPGLSVPLLFDLDQPGAVGRLRSPLGYWNAVALVMALALPVAVRLACGTHRRRRVRLAALAAGLVLAVVIGLTYSRGGLLATGTATVVMTALGGARLRGLVALAGVGLAALPVLLVAYGLPGTSNADATLAMRESDGAVLLVVLLVCLVALLGGAWAVLRWVEPRIRWSADASRTVFRLAAILASFAVLLGVAGVSLSERGLPGTVSDRVSAFTEPSQDDASDPGRIATTTSGNRWVWWREAAGGWSDRPLAGWGAGSFRATHLRYRVDELAVTQAHSVPLQFLTELGLVGFGLFVLGVGGLLLAGLRRADRDLGVAALAAGCGWVAHGFYDWDWNIPGATLPALVLLGVLAGGEPRRGEAAWRGVALPWRGFGARERRGAARPFTPAGRPQRQLAPALVVVLGVVVLSLVAASAILPSWADGKAQGAQVSLRPDATDAELAAAAAEADLAARLDPLALRPLLASATIARRRGRLLEARGFLLEAVDRQPASSEAWLNLAATAYLLADRAGFERAAQRALELDPRSSRARGVALTAVSNRTPPGSSATAVGTPLTPVPVAALGATGPVFGGPTGPTGVGGATGTSGLTGPTASGATGSTGP